MITIGLTGSIGMGKSTAADMLARLSVPVHDSDAQVHNLLSTNGEARMAIAATFPYFKYFSIYGRKDKSGIRIIDRKKLGALVFKKPNERKKLEAILHPLVKKSQNDFIKTQRAAGRDLIAFDIPLLFETGAEQNLDYVITVSAPAFIQAQRVLARPNMTANKFQAILKTQMPDGEKCARADYVLPTGLGRAHTMKKLKQILLDIRKSQAPQNKNTISQENGKQAHG